MEQNPEIQRSLGRLEGKLDQLLLSLNQHFNDDKENFGVISTRLAKVEKKVWIGQGAVALIASFFGYFIKSHT